MIKILQRYIAKTITQATALVTLIITGVLFLMLLLGELKNIGQGDYGLIQAVGYVLYRMPNELYQFSPMLILLGCITGLSVLSSYRELAVMRTSGFSIRQTILTVLGAAFALIMTISVIGEFWGPSLSYTAEVHKQNAQNGSEAVVTSAGIWLHVDNNFIHIQHVLGRDLLEGVTRYQFDNDHRLLAAYYADNLTLQNKQWVMNDVVKTSFYKNRTKSEKIPTAEWNLKINTNVLSVGVVDPNEMSLSKLSRFIRYLKQNKLQASEYQYEYWQRVFQPLASLLMVFLAIPFVLGAIGATTLWWRLMVGVLAGFGFFISSAFFGQLSIVYQVPAVVAAFLPLLVFAVIGMFMTVKMVRR